MSQQLIPVLVFFAVIGLGGAVVLVRGWRRRTIEERLFGQNTATKSPTADSHESRGFVDTVEQIGRAVSNGKPEAGLKEWLAKAGYYDDAAPTVYVGAQLVLGLFALTLGGAIAFSFDLALMMRGCIVVAVLAAFALLPNLTVQLRRRKRTGEVRRHLPDAIDLLEICVSSGMGLDMAWNAVCDEIRTVCPILADEMALSNLEMHLGAPRADAMRNMARRTGVEDISSLVATLVQSEKFGTSVSQALRTYADAMRTERSARAEEAAEKLAIKLLFPMVMFIFPCMFVVILGPAGVRIRQMFMPG
jgi:tight adherence protein C